MNEPLFNKGDRVRFKSLEELKKSPGYGYIRFTKKEADNLAAFYGKDCFIKDIEAISTTAGYDIFLYTLHIPQLSIYQYAWQSFITQAESHE